MEKNLKLYLVKREVYAKNIKEAMTNQGEIYEIQQVQTEEELEGCGFKK